MCCCCILKVDCIVCACVNITVCHVVSHRAVLLVDLSHVLLGARRRVRVSFVTGTTSIQMYISRPLVTAVHSTVAYSNHASWIKNEMPRQADAPYRCSGVTASHGRPTQFRKYHTALQSTWDGCSEVSLPVSHFMQRCI